MDILIRDNTTNEILHTVSIAADDDRRDDIVKTVLDQFPAGTVYVDDEPSATLTGDAAPRATTGGIPPVATDEVAVAALDDDEEGETS